MIKEKFSSNIGLDFFYKKYNRLKIKYPKTFFFNLKTRKRKLYVSKQLHQNIICNYLDVYFKDFHEDNRTMYFPLSGKLQKAKGKSFYKNKNNIVRTESIVWIWF